MKQIILGFLSGILVRQNQVHLVLLFLMIREILLVNSLVDTPNVGEIMDQITTEDFTNLGLEVGLNQQGFLTGWILREVEENSLVAFFPMS